MPPRSAPPPTAAGEATIDPEPATTGEARRVAIIAEALASVGQVPDLQDDCAQIHAPTRLITTDTLVEGVHFDFQRDDPMEVGAQAAVANLSDLAASGGRAGWLVWSLCLPEGFGEASLRALTLGFATVASRFGAAVVGGNLARTRGPLVVSVTAGGDLLGPRAWHRAAAQPGDVIYLTGPVGDAALGWRCPSPATHAARHAWRPHLPEAAALAAWGQVHAAMDVSDGLLIDAGRLAAASGLHLALDTARVPVSALYRHIHGEDRLPALTGGEDYVLLFTGPPGAPALPIGTCQPGAGVSLDGRPVAPTGFDHFAHP